MPYVQSLPFARGSNASYKAAKAAAPKRGQVTQMYMTALLKAGKHGLTDHESAKLIGRPLSTINSVRNAAAHCGLILIAGEREGPWGRDVTVFRHVDA